jgi:hypothetical protein
LYQRQDVIAPDDPGANSTLVVSQLLSSNRGYSQNSPVSYTSPQLVALAQAAKANGDDTITLMLKGNPSNPSLLGFHSKDGMWNDDGDDGTTPEVPVPDEWKPSLDINVPGPEGTIVRVQEDAALEANDPDGTRPDFMAARFSFGVGSAQRHNMSLMRFDISSLKPLTEAALNVYVTADRGNTPLRYFGLTEEDGSGDWDENTLTYNNAPGVFADGLSTGEEQGSSDLQAMDLIALDDPGDNSTMVVMDLGQRSTGGVLANQLIPFGSEELLAFLNEAIANGDQTVTFLVAGAVTSGYFPFWDADALVPDGYGNQVPIPETFHAHLLVQEIPEPPCVLLVTLGAVCGLFARRRHRRR